MPAKRKAGLGPIEAVVVAIYGRCIATESQIARDVSRQRGGKNRTDVNGPLAEMHRTGLVEILEGDRFVLTSAGHREWRRIEAGQRLERLQKKTGYADPAAVGG